MLSFIRRLTNSRIGVIVTLGVLAIIALAFGLTDLSNVAPTGGPQGQTVATVGDAAITDRELEERTRIALNAAREQNPDLDISSFVGAGGLEGVLSRVIGSVALEQFADASGMVASKALIDGRIASIPAFQGFNGQFDQATFERALASNQITQQQLRDDIRREIFAQWLLAPTTGASQVARQHALPYASLLLERRQADIAFVPARADAAAAPSDAQLTAFYNSNRSRYMLPERRVLRYALVSPESVAAATQVTDADLQAAYRAAAARYGASTARSVDQVIVADEAAARRIATAVRGGTSIADAARGAGLVPTTIEDASQEALAGRTSAAVAAAAFAAGEGEVAGPVRSPLGWHVLRVSDVTQTPARSLAEVREELTAEVRQRKATEAIGATQDRLDTGITDGATFDELIAETRLEARQTPPVTARGFDPDRPAEPDPTIARIAEAGFAAEEGDSPQLVAMGEDGSFALVALQRVVPAAARPLASIRETVARDYRLDQARQAARTQANRVIANVNRGTALRQAIGAAGIQAPPVQSIDVSRADLAARRQQLPPPVALMFSMKEGTAKLLEAPDRSGWFVVAVTGIDRGDASKDDNAINATRAGLGGVVGSEYAEQFTNAAQAVVGVTRDADAVARVRGSLTGEAP
ncbi:peptidylprolyl isomerase [Sphingomonas baiyangensis]|uniref:Parvulin-like PPIase n=1 Tax=Sphingomonas baiyangensis TaxID=2572576 RepID=A0A4U1L0P3_9SPHN|nr:peptidylprolyl isomerase [Sphingomonas baiyangensis]TKD50134.1 peptidylprolyl isomerase [Sphingomonas baiyangensis]